MASSGNRLTGSYFCSVTSYDMLASFTALKHSSLFNKLMYFYATCMFNYNNLTMATYSTGYKYCNLYGEKQ